MKHIIASVLLACLTIGLVGCSDDDDDLMNNQEPNNQEPNNQEPNNQEPNNQETCEPLTCEELGESCGVFSDGCDGEVDCGECECTADDFLDTCPTSPCEQLVGCDEGTCEYAPIEADDGTTCTECPGGDCDNTTVRYCNYDVEDVCPQYFCDPAREVTDEGETVYQNEIIEDHIYECGTCELGAQVCDAGVYECQDIDIANVDPEFAECDDTQTGSTFLYVDSSYTGGDADGSREAPFAELGNALVAANQRNAEALILAGASQFQESVDLRTGVSLIGGYEGRPSWTRNPDQVPEIRPTASSISDDMLAAVIAEDITDATHLQNLKLTTDDVEDQAGVSTVALLADNAPGLVLERVTMEPGAAGDGSDGDSGADSSSTGGNGADGEDGQNISDTYHAGGEFLFTTGLGTLAYPTPDMTAAGENSDCPDANGGQGARGDDNDMDASAHETRHLPGENSAAGLCSNPYGTTSNALYNSDNQCGGRLFDEGSTEYDDQTGRDGLAFESAADDGEDGLPNLSLAGGAIVLDGHGGDGAAGEAGRGGGGGASGHGRFEVSSQYWLGASGGGGGAGGCGGEGGQGGRAGGWSVGMVVQGTTGISVMDVSIHASNGGEGGLGGEGGAGAAGGFGGSGGTATANQDNMFSGEGDGTDGGDGSAGQDGGDGGAGAGGSSVALFCVDADSTLSSNGELELTTSSAGASAGESGLESSNINCTIED